MTEKIINNTTYYIWIDQEGDRYNIDANNNVIIDSNGKWSKSISMLKSVVQKRMRIL